MINRRNFITTLGAAAVSVRFSASETGHIYIESLKKHANQKGVLFGSSLALKYFDRFPAYRELFLAQCDVATPEFQMKWNSLSRQPGVYDFGAADQLVNFCVTSQVKVRGHTLVWHDSLPAWVPAQISPATAQSVMSAHIQKVAGHFAGKLYSWDVVNEILDPGSRRADGLRTNIWLQNIGADYIEQAFRDTAAADSKAILIWNENYLELSNDFGKAKRAALLNHLDRLLAKEVPIHGIGLEAHLRADQVNFLGDTAYRQFLDELRKRRMKVFITELDVQDSALPSDIQERDRLVAEIYRSFLSSSLESPAVKGVIAWGLSDAFSWIAGYRPRSDGLPVRPLAFDAQCEPKPAYFAILKALESAPRRG